jgi:hypothetical protein
VARNVLRSWAVVERATTGERKGKNMLWTIAVILTVLWALGLVTAHTMGGFVHILVILAVVAVIVRLVQGRKVL